ncbi:MAG: DUF3039 domain-containing protein [Acidimicrobiia bacterium]|jgi:hypothetical protein
MRSPHANSQVELKPAVITEEEIIIDTDDGDHDRFAHYVRKADIVRANVEGVPVMALCGKVWIPNRDPDRYPVCPTCKEIKANLFGS